MLDLLNTSLSKDKQNVIRTFLKLTEDDMDKYYEMTTTKDNFIEFINEVTEKLYYVKSGLESCDPTRTLRTLMYDNSPDSLEFKFYSTCYRLVSNILVKYEHMKAYQEIQL